jgi:zinc protease
VKSQTAMSTKFRCALAAITVLFASLFSPVSGASKTPAPAAASVFVPPDATRAVLSNGVVVYLYEDHELPLFTIRIRFRASPADETPRHAYSLMGPVWRAGGTRSLAPDDLDDKLESMATSLGTDADNESFSVTMSCLSRVMGPSLDLWVDLMRNPGFDAQKLAIAKGQAIEELRRKNETPNQIGRRAFRDVIYGPDHVYADDPLPEDVKRIARNDLVAIHRRVVAPQTAIIAASGDFDSKTLLADLERRFAGWAKTARVDPPYDYAVSSGIAGRVFLISKDFSQTRVSMGRLGITRHSPERFALNVADYILGGGGPSRLFAEIRSRRGLAYTVGSFQQAPTGPGMVGAISLTKANATVAVIDAMLNEFKKFSTEKVRPEELELAKSSIVNSYVFGFDSPFEIASENADREFFDYAPDELKTRMRKTLAVTRDDVLAVGRTYYDPAGLKIVVVGDPKKFEGPLDRFGEVKTIPLDSIR